MGIARHYIKLLPHLRDYALQIAPASDNWQQAVFDDITESGTKLTIERLSPTEHGVRVGLCGDKYYCEATVDRDRRDSIFVFKIDSALRRQLKSVPSRYLAELFLFTSRAAPTLDDVRELWGLGTQSKPENQDVTRSTRLESLPSDRLSKLLGRMPREVRALWRPVSETGLTMAPEVFLDMWRTTWIRFQLDRYWKLNPRQESLVKGVISEPQLDGSDLREMMSIFGVSLLNLLVRDSAFPAESLQELLRVLPVLPLLEHTRATIWALMARELKRDDLFRELYDAASEFQELQDAEVSRVWSERITNLLASVALETDDPLLQQLAEDCRDESDPVSFLSSWVVDNLEFEDTRSAKVKSVPPLQPTVTQAVEKAIAPKPELVDPREELTNSNLQTVPSEERSEQFNQWLLRLQAIDPTKVRITSKEISESLSRIANLASTCNGEEDLSELSWSLGTLSQDVNRWTSQLPDPVRLENDYRECSDAYARAAGIIGHDIDCLIGEGTFTPQDISETAALLGRLDILRALPKWVWGSTTSEERDDTPSAVFRRLLIPQERERVISVLSCVGETGGYDVSLIRMLPPPNFRDLADDQAMVEDHVRHWLSVMRELLSELPVGVVSKLGGIPQSSTLESQARQAVGTYRKINGRVPQSVAEELICALLMSLDERQCIRLGELYVEAIDFWENYFGTGLEMSFDQLQAWVGKRMKQVPFRDSSIGSEVRVDHNWIDAHGGKVPLSFTSTDDQTMRPYGYVNAPFVLISRPKCACNYKVSYEVKTSHRDGWPQQWENPEPRELSITEDEWRDDPDHPEHYFYTFKVRLPIKRKARGERFECQIGLTDLNSGRIVGDSKTFSWDLINDTPRERFVPIWSETVDPANVEKHPIGVQKKNGEILKRLLQNGSFCVTAPRRFGKSSLVEFLRAKAHELGFVVPPRIVCTNHYVTGQGIDYEKLWQTLSDNLQIELGSSISRPGVSGVPTEQAFDHVRRAAKNQGKKGIVILFDEAQVFFPTKADIPLGDILKDRLESHWSAVRPDMAPVMFGFIGLPTLYQRAGANLIGLLRPVAHNDLEESELNSVILSVTSNSLRTTREARRRLARTAANIWILQTLVTQLATHVQDDGRLWASFDDVIEVETAMRTKLREAQDPVISSYIRDILNDAEDVNQWKPNAAMLLAMAIADVKQKGVASARLYDEARIRLNSWYDSVASTEMTRLSYDEQQFREHLRILEERGVLRNREFTSPLLGDWLLGLGKQASDQDWKALFQSAAIKRIKIPGSMQKVIVDGSEATVWTTSQEQIKYAYRITQLHTDDDRGRFTETKELLEHLKVCIREGAQGSQYIFRLSEIGLSEDNDAEAVQVYRWIDGADLSRRVGQLPATYVADLGVKLATALAFLHGINIIHRDLSPRNVIVADEGGDPVIIDFGFARRLTPDVKSSFDSEYSAPEVRRVSAKWTKSADVYSLGATLLAVLDARDTCVHVRNILARCTHEDPDTRPDAARLVVAFEEAIRELHVDTRQKELWDRIQKACERDYHRISWFRGLVDKFKGNFISIGLGCYSSQFDRCREAANFLNQVLEASSSRPADGRLSLGRVKDENPHTGLALATEPIRFMHTIRKYHSHGEYGGKDRATGRFGPPPTDSQMLELAIEAGKQIADHVKIASIADLTSFLLRDNLHLVHQLSA